MLPFILVFLFMVLFDTLGTLIGVAEQAGLIRDNRLPRAKQALMSDAHRHRRPAPPWAPAP